MNIGQAAAQSGLPIKTLRYYEEIGLVCPARLDGNDYRDYSALDVEHLRFLLRARSVGFSLDVCRELLDLYRDENRRCSQVKKLVLEKIEQVETQLQELHALKSVLIDMADGCASDGIDHTIVDAPVQSKPAFMSFMLVDTDYE